MRVFYDYRSDDDADVVERIAGHVDDDPQHAEISMVGGGPVFFEVNMLAVVVEVLGKQPLVNRPVVV